MLEYKIATQDTATPVSSAARAKGPVFLLSETENDVLYLFVKKLISESPTLANLTITTILPEAEFIILNANTEQWVWQTLHDLRSESEHFLTPLLVIGETEWESLSDVTDAVLSSPVRQNDMVEIFGQLSQIQNRLRQLEALPKSIGQSSKNRLLLLRYFFSRDPQLLSPQRNYRAKAGYTYPLVQLLLNTRAGEEISFLASVHEAQLLNAKLVDKVNICPHCDHTQINFREICPKCASLNINEETTIHHFRCAYIGRESEYKLGMKLICPKCSKELRHIGVDYDKPSEVMWCQDCNHNFSEPALSCFCLVCAAVFGPEEAQIRPIQEFVISETGYRAAEEGVLPGSGVLGILKKELGFYKNEVFAEYLRLEIARCTRYKTPSTLARFNLSAANEALAEKQLKNSRKFKKDFAAIIGQTFRTSDMFTDLSGGDILIIFTHTDTASTQIAFKRLAENIHKRFNVELKLKYEVFDLSSTATNLDNIWETLK